MLPLSILHLSDLHYGSGSFLDDNKVAVDPSFRENAFRNFHLLLEHAFERRALDLVVVSGDITSRGIAAGLDAFRNEASKLIGRLVRSPRAVCIVPGNHDVRWGLDASTVDYFDLKFSKFRDLVSELGATSSVVPTGGLASSANGSLAFSDDVESPLYLDAKRRLLVLCINSSMRCGEQDVDFVHSVGDPVGEAIGFLSALAERQRASELDQALAATRSLLAGAKSAIERRSISDIPHVTQAQLDLLQRRLTQIQKRSTRQWHGLFKVAVLHHHLVPFPTQQSELKPFDITSDAARVLDMLASYGFHLVLTGHKHQPYTQAFRVADHGLHVLGGMTVGGLPPPGGRAGIRYLQVDDTEGKFTVKVADLPCDQSASPRSILEKACQASDQFAVEKGPPRAPRTVFMPQPIEQAVDDQLFARGFYKSNVKFTVIVTRRDKSRLLFETKLAYDVVNIDSASPWMASYNYDGKRGRVLHATFNERPLDLENPDFNTQRGITIPCRLRPQESGHVELVVQETYLEEGSSLMTSYHPASDLTVHLTTKTPGIRFDFEVLYAWKDWPLIRKGNVFKVEIKKGLLPYQGVRLNWKRQEGKS